MKNLGALGPYSFNYGMRLTLPKNLAVGLSCYRAKFIALLQFISFRVVSWNFFPTGDPFSGELRVQDVA